MSGIGSEWFGSFTGEQLQEGVAGVLYLFYTPGGEGTLYGGWPSPYVFGTFWPAAGIEDLAVATLAAVSAGAASRGRRPDLLPRLK